MTEMMLDMMVPEACETACPGARNFYMAMLPLAPGDDESRRMDGHEDEGMGEMLDMLPLMCAHEDAMQCVGENAACESQDMRRLQKAINVSPSGRRLASHMSSNMDDHDDQDDQDSGMEGLLPLLGLCASCPNGVCPEDFDPMRGMMAMMMEACETACPGTVDFMMAMQAEELRLAMAPAPGDDEPRRMDGHEDQGMGDVLDMLPMMCDHEDIVECLGENMAACESGMQGRRLAGHNQDDLDDHDDHDDHDDGLGGLVSMLPLCATVGENMSDADMWAFMAVPQECEVACSGTRTFMSSMLPVISDNWLDMLPLVCDNVAVVTCMGENSDGICQMGDDDEEGFHAMLPLCSCQTECPNFIPGMAATDRLTNAMDNATKSDLLCPKESSVRCMAGQSSCIGDMSADNVSIIVDILDGCSSVWIPRPLAVAVSMELSVADPAAFVANPASQTAVEQGIAEAAGVDSSKVVATLSVARRLRQSDRRLQGTVNVDATVEADSADAVDALQTRVAAVTAETMATELNSALTAAGIEATVVVSDLVAEVAPPPQADGAVTTTPAADYSNSGAFRTTFFGGFLIAFATQFAA